MSTSPKRLAALASAAVAFAGLTVLAPPAQAASTGLVISEVYGAGGNVGATYNADYVELSNPTGSLISVEGRYIHYRSATGASGGAPYALHGAVPAGGSYLIQMSSTGAVGSPLPSPDTSPAGFSMAASGGQVFLLDSGTAITANGNMAGVGGIIDMVGENGATSFETAAAPADATTTQSLTRAASDADDNSLEFELDTPSPRSTVESAGGTPTTDNIGNIQGTGFESPHAGTDVTTEGVVTAVYATGGLSGFYLQTEDSGGSFDPAARVQSDGIFVYQHTGAITVAKDDSVEVTGLVREVGGETQIAADGADVVDLADVFGPMVASTTSSWPDEDIEREYLEGMLYAPTGNFTITDNFPTNSNGELTLAQGVGPLLQPTEVARPGTLAFADQEFENAERTIVLDDASTTLFLLAPNQDETPPYISNTTPFRTGDTGTFGEDVIFSEGASGYRFEPLTQVVGPANTDSPYSVTSTRTSAPDAARIADGGTPQMKVASFNVLNYFTTLGDANNDNVGDGGCLAFNDRAGDGNTVSGGCNQRGAWDPQDLTRQQAKIVAAINALDADVVGLMEIENSRVLGETADEATQTLVTALNNAAGAGTWAANPSSLQLPTTTAEMDVITNAIIYKPAKVNRLGPALALGDQSSGNNTATDEAFANAREPIGQKFAPASGGEEVLVVVNHFKSKGSAGPFPEDTDQDDGQGAGNQSRIRQAQALRDWIPTVQGTTEDVLLIGDFNSYTMEDPLEVLYGAGYEDFEVLAGHEKYSYSFDGLSGSLDHVLGNAGAVDRFTGADVWNVNSVESIAMEYSRFNNHATDFHTNDPYRASDHDPVVVGLTDGGDDLEIQILGTNDFHGRLLNDTTAPTAGAAVLAGAVKKWRAANPDNTVFAAAGDLIGASTFESFIDKDKPTIDALNEAGLEVSSVGNHEFDQGYNDLVNRVMQPESPGNPQGGAEWQYLGANVKLKANGADALTPSWTKTMSGVEVGFVGAVTEELPALVSPAGITQIEVTDIVDAVNDEADALEADGADIIVMLVHEGAAGTDCATMDDDPSTPFGKIIHGVNDNVDAIISGHTHLEYNCSFPVAGWAGRDVTERPVVSAGQYGMALNQIVFTVDPTTHEVLAKSQAVLRLKNGITGSSFNYPADPATAQIVADAVTAAGPLGAVPLGQISGPFSRARFDDGGISDNRGGESTLGNLVAEVQRWATENPESGSAQIAFMNPGGLRADINGVGNPGDAYPRTVTYRQAADVQPFANTLVNMDLTGAQIKAALEQQWQPSTAARPFLRLGASKGFTYTYDPSKPQGSRITAMWLNGTPIGLGTTYSVTVNAFLASGGDNFGAFAGGTGKQDTGKIDLQAMVDYMAEFANTGAGDPPLPISFAQHAVGVKFPAGAPASYLAGTDHVKFDLTSLSMTEAGAVRDTGVTVKLGGTTLGTFPVTTTLSPPGNANSNDEAGTASVDVVLPASTPGGTATLVVEGATTGTSFEVPVTVTGVVPPPPPPPVLAPTEIGGAATPFKYGKSGLLRVTLSRSDGDGQVEVFTKEGVKLGTITLTAGKGTLTLAPKGLEPGEHELTLKYLGTSVFAPSTGTASVKVQKATPKVKVKIDDTITKSEGGEVVVRVTAPDDIKVKGKVKLVVKGTGKTVTGKLVKGEVVLDLPELNSVGKYTLKVTFLGSSLLTKANESVKFELVK